VEARKDELLRFSGRKAENGGLGEVGKGRGRKRWGEEGIEQRESRPPSCPT